MTRSLTSTKKYSKVHTKYKIIYKNMKMEVKYIYIYLHILGKRQLWARIIWNGAV